MSQAIVQSQRGSFDFSFSLLMQFIDVCPDEIWNKKFGGWPVWQQIYHTLGAFQFFLSSPGTEAIAGLVAQDVGTLAVQGDSPVSKEAMKDFAAQVKAAADAFLSTLTDADLTAKAEAVSARMQRETPYATVMVMMSAHILYHLGSCDAALREHGLKGVF